MYFWSMINWVDFCTKFLVWIFICWIKAFYLASLPHSCSWSESRFATCSCGTFRGSSIDAAWTRGTRPRNVYLASVARARQHVPHGNNSLVRFFLPAWTRIGSLDVLSQRLGKQCGCRAMVADQNHHCFNRHQSNLGRTPANRCCRLEE